MPLLVRHCEEQDADRGSENASELILVCERQHISYDAVARARHRWENGESISLDFDTADRLLAGMRMWDAWYFELREYYDAVDLNWQKCERDGCETWFRTSLRGGPTKTQKYCSRQCRQMMYVLSTGRIQNARKHNAETHCRNGHKRTVDNTDATGRCRECECIAQAARRTHCPQGHEYTAENTALRRGRGDTLTRRCKRCLADREAARRAARVAA